MKVFLSTFLSLISLVVFSQSLYAQKEDKPEPEPEVLRYNIFELALVPIDFTWARTKNGDGDLSARRETRTVPKSIQASYFTKKYGFGFSFHDDAHILADGNIRENPGRLDFYWGLQDKLYLDFGLDINRLVWKKEDDNTDKEINRNLIIRGGIYYRKVTKSKMLKGGAYLDWMNGGSDTSNIKGYNSLGIGLKGDYYFMSLAGKFYIGTGGAFRLSLIEKVDYRQGNDFDKSWAPIDLNWRILQFNMVM